jgi:hypothetical protein
MGHGVNDDLIGNHYLAGMGVETMSMTDHEMNKALAELIGVAVVETFSHRLDEWMLLFTDELLIWEPLADHNHMAQVEAWLRKKGYGYLIDYWPNTDTYQVTILELPTREVGHRSQEFLGCDTDKLYAMAKAMILLKGDG